MPEQEQHGRFPCKRATVSRVAAPPPLGDAAEEDGVSNAESLNAAFLESAGVQYQLMGKE